MTRKQHSTDAPHPPAPPDKGATTRGAGYEIAATGAPEIAATGAPEIAATGAFHITGSLGVSG